MGLDVVEIVMGVEDEFQIKIPHEIWSEVRTVGDLSAYVSYVVSGLSTRDCPAPCIFATLRRTICSLVDVPRNQIRPSTALSTIPFDRRSEIWHRLRTDSGYLLPPLRLPQKIATLDAAFRILMVLMGLPLIVVAAIELPVLAAMLVPVVAIAALIVAVSSDLAGWWTKSFATELPQGCSTVADLVRRVTHVDGFREFRDASLIDTVETFLRVKRIVCQVLNVPPEIVSAQTRFIEDLRAD